MAKEVTIKNNGITNCDANSNQLSLDYVQSHIYNVRGVQVMVDYELANLYGVETRVLNQAVKRNIERFPERFMFQLTKEEKEAIRQQTNDLKSHNVI